LTSTGQPAPGRLIIQDYGLKPTNLGDSSLSEKSITVPDDGDELFSVEELLFGPGGSPICAAVNFRIRGQGVLWIRGASGGGKTTLLKTLARLFAPIKGKMSFKGVGWRNIPPQQWRASIIYVPQKPLHFRETVKTTLLRPFQLRVRRSRSPSQERLEEALSEFLIPTKALDMQIHELSVGQAARVAMIRALLCNPTGLLIDEASAALDDASRGAVGEKLAGWLKNTGGFVIGVSHDIKFIEKLPGEHLYLEPLGNADTFQAPG
jgi:putative ABC transport system ATP-binding protein